MLLNDLDYFAAKDGEDLASDLYSKITKWSDYVQGSGLKDRWIKSYRYYYGRHFGGQWATSDAGVHEAGDDGEFKLLTVNHYRNLLKHIHILTTNQKPAFDVRAINTDLKSMQQARLGGQILDTYLKEKRLARYLKNAAEQALVFGKGFIYITWEPAMGKPYSVEQMSNKDGTPTVDMNGMPMERMVYEGDVEVQCPSCFDVYVDQSQEDWNKLEWCVIRQWKNKFNLAIRYPDMKEEILQLRTKTELDRNLRQTFLEIDETSDVPLFAFYHKRTDALPNGRYVLFADESTVLYDGPIPYEQLPLFRIVPGEVFGTCEGYSDGFDLLPLQEVINTLASTAFTNQAAFGIQNILLPEGCNITGEMIGQGLRAIRFNPQAGAPSALQLTQTPPELFQFMKIMEQTMETISGVNAVARGNPESQMGKGSSGAALALIQSMAVQYMSGYQQSWAELLEDSGTFILKLLHNFAKTDRMISMAGKANRWAMSQFTGDDLSQIDRVIVELGNPMTRTTAGRVNLADTLLEKGMIPTGQEYLNVMNTGQLDSMTEAPVAELALIRQENEALMEGKPVKAIVGDAHLLHMQEHKALLANPEVRLNSNIVGEVLSHIQDHMQLRKTQDPLWSQIAGEPPDQSGPPSPAQGGAPKGPSGPAPQGPQPEAPNPAGIQPATPAQPPKTAPQQ